MMLYCGCGVARSQPFCQEEQHYARMAIKQIEGKWPLRPTNDELTKYIQSLGNKLAAGAAGGPPAWNFVVIRDRQPYAFSVGYGYVYVTEGAVSFARDESELAAIIAHEIGHQLAGHFCRKEGSLFNWNNSRGNSHTEKKVGTLNQVFDLAKEQEADRWAVQLMQPTRFDPHAMLETVKRLQQSGVNKYTYGGERTAALEKLLASLPHKQLGNSEQFTKYKQELTAEQ